jgi:hypothetical protein
MFVEKDGPTALRPELLRALSLSVEAIPVPSSTGLDRCCAALSGVWNGKRGYVAVLVRNLDVPEVRRFVNEEPIASESLLASAVDAGLAFAESMGFTMDGHAFQSLPEAQQRTRLQAWNEVRKTARRPRYLGPLTRPTPAAPAATVPAAAPAPASVQAPRAPEPRDDGQSGKSVLGRLSIERRTEDGRVHAPATPIGRVRSHF